jgi:AcrR family transcriptional regulator
MSSTPKAPARPAAPPASANRRLFRGVAHEERQQQRRAQLIAAGIEAFGEHGYHAVTVRKVCVGAGLTERYFYESFNGLEDLFVAVYRQINQALMQATVSSLESTPPDAVALAERALRVFLKFVRDDPQRARIFLIDAISISHDVQRVSAAVAGDYAGLIRRFIGQLFPQAVDSGLSIDLIATGLIGVNVHIATQWLREDFRTPLDQVLLNMVAFYRVLAADWSRPAIKPRPAPVRKPRRS